MAAVMAIRNGISVRKAANQFNVCKSTLQRWKSKDVSQDFADMTGAHRRVFNSTQEKEIEEFVIMMNERYDNFVVKRTF
jgi:transposase